MNNFLICYGLICPKEIRLKLVVQMQRSSLSTRRPPGGFIRSSANWPETKRGTKQRLSLFLSNLAATLSSSSTVSSWFVVLRRRGAPRLFRE